MERRKWLAKNLGTTIGNINDLYENPIGLDFLLIWTRFETINFQGFMKFNYCDDINRITTRCNIKISEEIDEIFSKFFQRYQRERRLLALCHKRINSCLECRSCSYCKIRLILQKQEPTDLEKVYFLVYVIYRYRNNMFHGNKGLDSWITTYEEQINDCIKVMMTFTRIV